MIETVLCYIKIDGKYLMLYRNKKKNDPNAEKWMGVGGHIEDGEDKVTAMKREIFEETGLTVLDYSFKGVVTFINDNYQEKMYLFVIDKTEGVLIDCNEGELALFNEEEIYKLNMWEGDKIFLPYIFSNKEYFELKLYYKNDVFVKSEVVK